ncbi:hypothetical protein ACM67B_02035 [Neisseria sp. CCUG17229]|uniref:hypothetical protein n=1 Tax=Neisseria sp. CCUG17229 TaxID=3392036 RepID=UPI003A0FDF4B
MKILTALFVAAALGAASVSAVAAGFGHQQDVSIDGRAVNVMDTSARIIGNAQGNAPQLLDNITDGKTARAVPGYKIMFMSRAYSLNHAARPPRGEQTVWGDNRAIHRGTKVLVGIPVVNGKMQLNQARLLDMAVIDDVGVDAAAFKAEDKTRPRGKQIAGNDAKIGQTSLKLSRLELPDMQTGERSGGGVVLEASAVIDGKTVATKVNSTFREFDVAKPDNPRGFAVDERFLAK